MFFLIMRTHVVLLYIHMNYKRILQVLLVAIGAYDVYLAVLGLFFRDNAVAYAVDFFNFNLELTTSTYWLIGLLSTYLLAFAGFIFVAATDPIKYMKIVYVILGVFAVRLVQRLYFLSAAQDDPTLVANTTAADMHLVSIVVAAAALLFLVYRVKK